MDEADPLLPDWRDAQAYAVLRNADRSLFAWEWLRRQPDYRRAWRDSAHGAQFDAASFGLVAAAPPTSAVPQARPLWRAEDYPLVLSVGRASWDQEGERFDLAALEGLSTLVRQANSEHLLLSDGFRTVRLDAPVGTFDGPSVLEYRFAGLRLARAPVLVLRQFLLIAQTRRFSRSLHPPEQRARRWLLMLRASDALRSGADQRDIAAHLLSPGAREPGWRLREPSLRSQVQRLVRAARAMAGGGYRTLLH